jgi:UDP-N-acetylglucosamine diphosphorylase/glucosamine-1-phosphate N-acetyltransferase
MAIIFDESNSFNKLLPLTYLRSYFDLVVGALTLRKRAEISEINCYFVKRNPFYLDEFQSQNFSYDDKDIIINESVYISNEELKRISNINVNSHSVFLANDRIVGYTADLLNKNDLKSSNRVSINATILEKPYDVIRVNKAAIQEDLVFLAKFYEEKKISNNKIGKYGIYSNGDFYIEDNVFLDTRSGPIVIEDGAYIQAFTRIEGPSYIGKNAQIVSFCNIRKSYIGNHCVVGGELSNSIILDYTNSRHSSYIGDSYIATWVNIGAHTVTSNLKHTYGIIRYDDLGKIYQTGLTKFGAIISDFSKTSIGCLILSGKSTGFSSIVNFLQTKSIPSFTIWQGMKEEAYEFYFDSAVETAKRYMSKKGVDFTYSLYKTFQKIYEATKEDRLKFNAKKETLRF